LACVSTRKRERGVTSAHLLNQLRASAADSLSRAVAPPPVRTLEDLKPTPLIVASRRTKRNSREADKSARHAKLAQRDSCP
jgi:hypothetical protein